MSFSSFNDALLYIQAAAWVNYSFYLGYCDDDLETCISQISSNIVSKEFSLRNKKSVVFLDAFSKDTSALSSQYIDAIIAAQMNLLYIYENDILHDERSSSIYNRLVKYDNAKIIRVPIELEPYQKAQWLYDTIVTYGSDKLIMQLLPDSAIECTAVRALPNDIIKFQVNLTDHTFWLGKGCTDYTFEFRQKGCSISRDYRGLEKNQILLMPFYPSASDNSFEGFPIHPADNTRPGHCHS